MGKVFKYRANSVYIIDYKIKKHLEDASFLDVFLLYTTNIQPYEQVLACLQS
jgi:hypothetical protein